MTNPPPTTIHHHPNPTSSLIPLLHTHLPQSLPLLRRIQHDLTHPSKTAYILSTPLPPASTKTPPFPAPWLAAHINLFHGRETQITLYTSLEQTSTPTQSHPAPTFPPTTSTLSASARAKTHTKAQLLSLLQHTKTQLLPEYLAQHPGGAHRFDDASKVPAAPPTAFLIGSMHTGVLALLLRDEDVLRAALRPVEGVRIHRVEVPLAKFVFGPQSLERERLALPDGYRLAAFPDSTASYDLVRSRTRIFRSDGTLSRMGGVAVYHRDGAGPVAWAFVSVDGSLSTLQVEPGHRGRGLAGVLVRETVRRAMGRDFGGVVRDGYWHADVEKGNMASKRVMEKCGGRMEWTVAWVAVEVV